MLLPRLMFDLLRHRSERLLSYYECVVQAFISHTYGTTSHTVLMIMAFDRYEAICNPLSYTAVMTGKMVVKLTLSAWGGGLGSGGNSAGSDYPSEPVQDTDHKPILWQSIFV